MFNSEIYVERRKKLMEKFIGGLLLFPGNNESSMNYADNTYHFRQDSSFLYYFGLDFPELSGVIDVDEGKCIIFGDDLTIEMIVWMGTQPTLAERALKAGITITAPANDLYSYINKVKGQKRSIHYLPPYRDDIRIKLNKLLDIDLDSINNSVSVELILAVADQRNIKAPEEIEEIEKAVNVTVDMHLAAMKMIRPGMTEAEVTAAVYQKALAANGDIAFPIIATIHGETLHNHYHGNTLKSGDLFLLDAGFETSLRYAGDMSSTIPVDKTFTERQKEIYNVALNAHNAAIEALKPGVAFKGIHLLAAKKIAEGMKELGFMKGDLDDAVEAGAHALFFPCGLGHMMGLDVHDMENFGEEYVGYENEKKSTLFGLKSLRLGRVLKPGFVLTIEPGIYFIPELIDMWRAEGRFSDFINYEKVNEYRNFGGLRNEEDLLITEKGYRLLGKPLPKTVEEVEAVR